MQTIKEKPILFSGPMVRAILDGKKTQTRRIIAKKVLDDSYVFPDGSFMYPSGACPYGEIGSRLWVRESWAKDVPGCESQKGLSYKADHITGSDGPAEIKWKPSIHMPRWASRINLEITGIRVERLQDISREDAKEEGFWPSESNGLEFWNGQSYGNAELAFQACWNDINGSKHPWDSNPYVWVVEFKRIEHASSCS